MKCGWKKYIIGIIIPPAVGGLAALLTRGSMDIYDSIVQPALAPPGILFPIVWTLLYLLMGVGSVRVHCADTADGIAKTRALWIYGLQLGVNFFWSIIFFDLRAFLPAFLWLVLLWVLLIVMIVRFYKIDRTAGLLQLPYLLWVTFAGYLNLSIYLLNR